MNRLRRFMINGILMAAVSILMRYVAVAFNVYISNKIGAVAMGLFSLITTVYGFGVTLATSGINLATTRLVAQVVGDGDKGILKRDAKARAMAQTVLRQCICYSLFFGALATALSLFLAEWIGVSILGDERTVSSLKVLALTLTPLSLCSVYGGYFSALRRAYKNAVTQVVGQAAKIFACIFLFSFMGASDVESACLCVVCGGAAAEILSFLLAWILYLAEKKKSSERIDKEGRSRSFKSLLSNALPLAFSTYMRSALVTIEHVLIPSGLQRSGSSRDASLAAYGTVSSMVFPLVLFPSAVSASFAGLLIPEIASSYQTNDSRRICGIISSVLDTVLMFSIGCAGIMMSFSFELARQIYPASSDAGKYIFIIAPLIPIMYLDTAVDSMLKGLGEHVYSMGVNIADALMSVILVWLLLPRIGIYGYIVTVYFTEIMNAALSITRLLLKSQVKTHVFLWVGRPLLCIVIATRITHLIFDAVALGSVWIEVLIAAIAYLTLLVVFGGIKPKAIRKSLRYIMSKE